MPAPTDVTPLALVVEGEPVPWRRPEQTGRRRYTDTRASSAANAILLLWRSRVRAKLDGPVRVRIDFYLSGSATDKPDVDNLAKLVLDALAREAFGDDALVVELSARKHGRADDPRTEIAVWADAELS